MFGMGELISIHAPPRGATLHGTRYAATSSLFQFTPLREGRRCSRPARRVRPFYFNSRPSARGDGFKDAQRFTIKIFQFTPLREGRQGAKARSIGASEFQFTPLREGRRRCGANKGGEPHISIHAPPRGATPRWVRTAAADRFQFTPLREGRRSAAGADGSHSGNFNSRPSARGDCKLARWLNAAFISIHAPPRGATLPCITVVAVNSYFNSRPSARGDTSKCRIHSFIYISIHAPPRGATCVNTYITILQSISIHAPPRGATCIVAGRSCTKPNFNSRPSARGDFTEKGIVILMDYFNSRPSARGDQRLTYDIPPIIISIHAPPRGATSRR